MTKTPIRLTCVKVLAPEAGDNVSTESNGFSSSNVMLRWRMKFLLVTAMQGSHTVIPALRSDQWLRDCLQHSDLQAVCLDIRLSEAALCLWVNACEAANKAVFLRFPASVTFEQQQPLYRWETNRLLDCLLAALLLLILAPLLVFLMALVKLSSPGPIFYKQWYIGCRGRLFRVWKFRTMTAHADNPSSTGMDYQRGLHKRKEDFGVTPIGRFLRKYGLEKLPQLVNVLRGEMSFIGPQPWAIYDAIRVKPDGLHRLRVLPGMTNIGWIPQRSHLVV
jgi:lipopolysaccharide/colanic/teichoic acid biosynthesis glycosyltransferase